jgi:glycosyltransferase involved in cell wall biosynthesis
MTLGVLIRFSNSSATLPGVLAALKQQSLQPDVILGVNNGSRDGSPALIEAAGGHVIEWSERYEHSKVLNFGLRHLHTDLVLVLSSHTVLEAPDTLARMVEAMRDKRTACVSIKWDNDPFYSDAIDWDELRAKGLKFGSIYSNSMGMIRRAVWEQMPFDESQLSSEDYAWAIEQLKRGYTCKRLAAPFSYQRAGSNRDGEFANVTFQLALRHRLKVAWLGLRGSVKKWLLCTIRRSSDAQRHQAQLHAWLRAKTRWA